MIRFLRSIAAIAGSSAPLRIACLLALFLMLLASVSEEIAQIRIGTALQWRDLSQDYLAEQAIARGENPYLPIPALSERFQPKDSLPGFNHPTPHAPVLLMLLAPFAEIPELRFHEIWILFSLGIFIACGAVAAYRLRHRGVTAQGALFLIAVTVTSPSAWLDLHYGQHNCMLLPLVLLLWAVSYRAHWTEGILLGITLALRGFGAPFLLFLLLERRIKSLAAAAVTFCGLQALAARFLSPEIVFNYFTQYAGEAVRCWKGQPANASLVTLPQKLFGSRLVSFGSIPAVCREPTLPLIINVLGPLVALGLCVALWRRRKTLHFQSKFALLLLLSIISAPLTWPHYFILLMPAAFAAAIELKEIFVQQRQSGRGELAALIVLVLLFRADWSPLWYKLSYNLFGKGVYAVPVWMLALSCAGTIAAALLVALAPPNFIQDKSASASSVSER